MLQDVRVIKNTSQKLATAKKTNALCVKVKAATQVMIRRDWKQNDATTARHLLHDF
jgi:hypothetical protein